MGRYVWAVAGYLLAIAVGNLVHFRLWSVLGDDAAWWLRPHELLLVTQFGAVFALPAFLMTRWAIRELGENGPVINAVAGVLSVLGGYMLMNIVTGGGAAYWAERGWLPSAVVGGAAAGLVYWAVLRSGGALCAKTKARRT